jgi:hypothetical protein
MGGLPAINPKFQSPAMGGDWQPDYGKYEKTLARQVKQAVEQAEKAIYD